MNTQPSTLEEASRKPKASMAPNCLNHEFLLGFRFRV